MTPPMAVAYAGPHDTAAEQPSEAPVAAERQEWVDVARGIGIALVVYGHALRALFPGGRMPEWARLQDELIYGFHMPLFFVASGLFLWQQIGRGRAPFLRDRLLFIIYPYFLWSLITGVLELLAEPWVNSPVQPIQLLLLPVAPIEQYWFLYALLVVHLVALLAYPSRRWLVVLALILPLACSLIPSGLMAWRSLTWLPYLAGGVLAGGALKALVRGRPGLLITGAVLAWLCFLAAYALPGVPLRSYALGFAGTLGTLLVSALIARTSLVAPLAALGAASMAIFVTHTICSAGARAVAFAIWPQVPVTMVLAATTLAGILAPLLLYWWAGRVRLRTILGLGKDRRVRVTL